MPKYYCEYCDIYLTHSSPAGRRQHASGRRHINQKVEYFQNLIRDPSFRAPAFLDPNTAARAIQFCMTAGPDQLFNYVGNATRGGAWMARRTRQNDRPGPNDRPGGMGGGGMPPPGPPGQSSMRGGRPGGMPPGGQGFQMPMGPNGRMGGPPGGPPFQGYGNPGMMPRPNMGQFNAQNSMGFPGQMPRSG